MELDVESILIDCKRLDWWNLWWWIHLFSFCDGVVPVELSIISKGSFKNYLKPVLSSPLRSEFHCTPCNVFAFFVTRDPRANIYFETGLFRYFHVSFLKAGESFYSLVMKPFAIETVATETLRIESIIQEKAIVNFPLLISLSNAYLRFSVSVSRGAIAFRVINALMRGLSTIRLSYLFGA